MRKFFSLLLALVLSFGCVATAASASSQEFTDVAAGDYFYDAVQWAVEKGITKGVTPDRFAPQHFCTRAQAVTMLWRAAGCPTEEGKNPFTDVKTGDYFYHAVQWAVKKGITQGVRSDRFAPQKFCTRGQIMTFIWRAKGCQQPSDLSPTFSDVRATDYYASAVQWAVEKDITKGVSPTRFAPGQTCTRGQIVTFLYRADPVESTEHIHEFVLTEECPATCTKDGYRRYTCKSCQDTYTEIIPAEGHDYHWEITVPPTDTTTGTQEYTCRRCHAVSGSPVTLPAGSQHIRDYEIDMGNGETATIRGFYHHAYEDQMFRMLNDYRTENGEAPLLRSDGLVEPAEIRGREIAVVFDHVRPNGQMCFTVSDLINGENIACGQTTPEQVMSSWKNSPGHNANMLRSNFSIAGVSCFIAMAQDNEGRIGWVTYWVQLFGI